MNEIISVGQSSIGGNVEQTVNARDLHYFLGVGKDFSNWVKDRIEQYGFIENQDFVCSPVLASNGRGGHNRKDYHLTLDMAKELSMVERNDKGKEARQYFIACEKKLRESPSNQFSIPTTLSGALRLAAEQAETIEKQTALIEHQKSKVEFVEKYVEADGYKSFRQVCKILGAKEWAFRAFLEAEKIMYPQNKDWLPYAQHMNAGRFKVFTGVAENGQVFNSPKFTAKGIEWIAGEWAKYQLKDKILRKPDSGNK